MIKKRSKEGKQKKHAPKEVRVTNLFNKLNGEHDVLTKEEKKLGSLKQRFPIEIKEMRAVYYTKTKLSEEAKAKFIKSKLLEFHDYSKTKPSKNISHKREKIVKSKLEDCIEEVQEEILPDVLEGIVEEEND
jgi:hypothetical protein